MGIVFIGGALPCQAHYSPGQSPHCRRHSLCRCQRSPLLSTNYSKCYPDGRDILATGLLPKCDQWYICPSPANEHVQRLIKRRAQIKYTNLYRTHLNQNRRIVNILSVPTREGFEQLKAIWSRWNWHRATGRLTKRYEIQIIQYSPPSMPNKYCSIITYFILECY